MLKMIKSVYANIKSCVRYENHLSVGLMQGESLSPFLFPLYNRFEDEFTKICVNLPDRNERLNENQNPMTYNCHRRE